MFKILCNLGKEGEDFSLRPPKLLRDGREGLATGKRKKEVRAKKKRW